MKAIAGSTDKSRTRAGSGSSFLLILFALNVITVGVLAGMHGAFERFLLLGLAMIAIIGGVLTNTLAGMGIGIGVAALYIVAARFFGIWSEFNFTLIAVSTASLFLLGWMAGACSSALKAKHRMSSQLPAGAVLAAEGSLGLLPFDAAKQRIAEELKRCLRNGIDTGLVVVRIEAIAGNNAQVRHLAKRGIARIIESITPHGVPFMIDENTYGIVLPDSFVGESVEVSGTIIEAASELTIADRDHGTRIPLINVLTVSVGSAAGRDEEADELLNRAQRSLRQVEQSPQQAA